MRWLDALRGRWEPADPSKLGVREGSRLAPCPARPNCVSSQAEDESHRVSPLSWEGEPGSVWRRLKEILGSWSRTEIVEEEDGYLRAECRTRLGFVDDLELLLEPEESVLHVRSASRLGYRDFGVNRRRVERLREELEKQRGR